MAIYERFDFEEVEAVRVGVKDKLNMACIVYRIEDTLIDTGPANQWRLVRRFLEERDVTKVVLTHHHEDHSGNAARIQKDQKAHVYGHEAGLEYNSKGFTVPLYRRMVWGKPKPFEAEPLPREIRIGGLQLRPIHCPGHAPDQVCYLESRRGWLFSGDMYVSSKPKFLRKGEDPNEEIESLQNLLDHHFDTLLCAHRGVVLNGYEAMRDKLKYLISLREQVRHYLGIGDSVKEVTARLLGKEELIAYASRGEISKRNYVEAFARHFRQQERNAAVETNDPDPYADWKPEHDHS